MIKWRDEELAGEPRYNLVSGDYEVIHGGVRFRAADNVVASGTPFSAENMDRHVQVAAMPRTFYYDGAIVPIMPDTLHNGVILAKCAAGAVVSAVGTIYLYANGETQMLTNPVQHKVERECVVLCQLGWAVRGSIWGSGD